jgi:DNA (cytosine-5)-methyltransferase 1
VATRTVNILSLFSGYAGNELGLSSVIPARAICYVEREASVAAILGNHFRSGTLSEAPIWSDICTFDPEPWRGKVDLILASPPCQPHSQAGKGLQGRDKREQTQEVIRIAEGLGRPTIFLENVPRYKQFWFENARPELQRMGYQLEEAIFSAEEVGFPHKRDRFFALASTTPERIRGSILDPAEFTPDWKVPGFVAHGDGSGPSSFPRNNGKECRVQEEERKSKHGPSLPRGSSEELAHSECETVRGGYQVGREEREATKRKEERQRVRVDAWESDPEVAHSECEGLEGIRWAWEEEPFPPEGDLPFYPPGPEDHDGWAYLLSEMPTAKPSVCIHADGRPPYVARSLRAAGNGVIPLVAAQAYRSLTQSMIGEQHENS